VHSGSRLLFSAVLQLNKGVCSSTPLGEYPVNDYSSPVRCISGRLARGGVPSATTEGRLEGTRVAGIDEDLLGHSGQPPAGRRTRGWGRRRLRVVGGGSSSSSGV